MQGLLLLAQIYMVLRSATISWGAAALPHYLLHKPNFRCVQASVLREHFESGSPYYRLPLSDHLEELAEGQEALMQLPLADLHPLSWHAPRRAWHRNADMKL